METVLVPRSVEQHDLDSVPNRTRLEFTQAGVRLTLTLDLFNFGCDLREHEFHYVHPAPPFCRLFHFSGTASAGAEIISGGTVRHLDAGAIYLLNAEHSFDVRYFAGSQLCYAHLRLTDQTRRSVFHDSPAIQELRDPSLNTLVEQAWESAVPLHIQTAATMATSRFAEPLLEQLRERGELFDRFAPMLAATDAIPPAKLRITELAGQMNMTPSALSKNFRRTTGLSLKSYLDSIYLDRARELLIRSAGTMEEIAFQLGHSDVHYFFHAFRRLTGCTPGEYRSNRSNFGTKTDQCPEIARF